VDQNPETNVREVSINVTTDLEYIHDYPESISDEGFVILCNYEFSAGVYHVHYESGFYYGEIRLNTHLSWANLHHRYFMHNRIIMEGHMNNAHTNFFTAQKTKKQPCNVIICNAFDPTKEITTELGEVYFGGAKAVVEEASIKPDNSIKLSLLYGPLPLTPIPAIDDPLWILITSQAGCVHYHAELSEAAPVGDLEISIQYIIWSAAGAVVCFDTVVWTIDAGLTTDEYTIDPVCAFGAAALAAGGCISYPLGWHVTGLPEWNVFHTHAAGCKCADWS
jgi:hypothetical protein